jgi:hypothetical protein
MYAVQRPAPAGLVMRFACVDAAQIAAGLRTLSAVLERVASVSAAVNNRLQIAPASHSATLTA